MLVFVKGGKPENPEKNPRSKDENQQQTQPTYDAESLRRKGLGGGGGGRGGILSNVTPYPVLVSYAQNNKHRETGK